MEDMLREITPDELTFLSGNTGLTEEEVGESPSEALAEGQDE